MTLNNINNESEFITNVYTMGNDITIHITTQRYIENDSSYVDYTNFKYVALWNNHVIKQGHYSININGSFDKVYEYIKKDIYRELEQGHINLQDGGYYKNI